METKSNKIIVRERYRKIIRDLDLSLVDTYVREDYIQHSPMIPTGKHGLLQMLAFLKTLPKPAEKGPSPIIRVIGDGDMVAVHLDIKFMGKRAAVIDLFRLENGQLAEHWDASQDIADREEGLITKTNGSTTIDESAEGIKSKKLVERFYSDVHDRVIAKVLEKYRVPDYIEHDKSNDLINNPRDFVKLHRILAEGNFVVAHCELNKGNNVISNLSIFRIEDSKIAEHWSVEQKVPETMAHGNGMF
jgi:predicted SnoaL-like aldol condensation-catalyzing enzyme